jgi:hypothetical protein
LRALGGTFIVYEAETNLYLGLLDTAAARTFEILSTIPLVVVSTSITPLSKLLNFTVSARVQDAEAIAQALSSKGLFLQHPEKIDEVVNYYNPHYLVRPGSTFQDALSDAYESRHETRLLNPAVKSQILHAIDFATGPTEFSEIAVSSSLITALKPLVLAPFPLLHHGLIPKLIKFSLTSNFRHQKKALAMMAEKEAGEIDGMQFPTLWVDSHHRDAAGRKL